MPPFFRLWSADTFFWNAVGWRRFPLGIRRSLVVPSLSSPFFFESVAKRVPGSLFLPGASRIPAMTAAFPPYFLRSRLIRAVFSPFLSPWTSFFRIDRPPAPAPFSEWMMRLCPQGSPLLFLPVLHEEWVFTFFSQAVRVFCSTDSSHFYHKNR